MFRSLFKMIIYIAGILFVGSFILSTFPATQPIWEEIKNQFSFFYQMSLAEYGTIGTIIIIGIAIFLIAGKR